MSQKAFLCWLGMLSWCAAHPGKKYALARPEGCYVVTFVPRPEPCVVDMLMMEHTLQDGQ